MHGTFKELSLERDRKFEGRGGGEEGGVVLSKNSL